MNSYFEKTPMLLEGGPDLDIRLPARHAAIIRDNLDLIVGASVIDIASNNGRWSFAALDAGASRVMGIEARRQFLAAAVENRTALGIDRERCEFIEGDVFSVLPDLEPGGFDTALLLGFLYHTLRHDELFYQLRRLGVRNIVVDTKVSQATGPVIELRSDSTTNPMDGIDEWSGGRSSVVVGYPTVEAITFLLAAHGYGDCKHFDWSAYLRDHPKSGTVPQLNLYRTGGRVTFTCRLLGR